jgi:hypothetical protein
MQSYHRVHVQLGRKDWWPLAGMLTKVRESARVLRRASILRQQLEVHAQEGTPEVRLQQKQIHAVRDLNPFSEGGIGSPRPLHSSNSRR